METILGKVIILIILFLICAPWVSILCKKRSTMIYRVLFAGACVAVCCITLLSRSVCAVRTALLIPFFTYSEAWKVFPLNIAPYLSDGRITFRELLLAFSYSIQYIGLNILLFVPFGYLLKKLYGQKNGMWITLHGMFFSLLIEYMQYKLCLGWFDIDDIISNTLGSCTGYVLCLATNRCVAKVQAFLVRKDQRNRDR